MPKPATGKTPVRNARVSDEVWLQALAKAEVQGETASDAVTTGLRMYAAAPLPSAYGFAFANWPEAARWAQAHSKALRRLHLELDPVIGESGDVYAEWLAVAIWLPSTHHQGDPAQQKRVITGHILRRLMQDEGHSWWGRYRDSRHLSETVQAILERHLPLREG